MTQGMRFTPARDEEWDAAWRNCPHATAFHSRWWHELWNGSGGRESFAMRVEFEDDSSAVVPISRRRVIRGLAHGHDSSPAGTFGGWLAPGPLGSARAASLARAWMKRTPNLAWRVNPYDPDAEALRVPGMERDSTQAVDLTPGFEPVFRGWSKGHRATINQARRAGVAVEPARGEADWKAYYDAYLDSIRRWGGASMVYPWSLFEKLLSARPIGSDETAGFDEQPAVRLWTARCDDRVVAGALCLYAHRHVVYWHGAALEAYFDRRPVHMMLYRAMEDACSRGLAWFDLNPSGGNEGVRAFKRGFGARELDAPMVRTSSGLIRIARRLRRK